MKKGVLKNQKGFTLIEIIAVLVILGILAAVAIPRYFDLQGQARGKAVYGAIAALQSHASQHYSQGLLNGSFTANSWTAPAGTVNVGEYWGTIAGTGPRITVTVTGGPTGWSDFPSEYSASKSFNLW